EMQVLSDASASEHAARQRLWQGAARLLVITHGARPVHGYTREAHGTVPTFAMPAVDTTGAGDAFTSGLLHGLDHADASSRTLDSLLDNPPRLERILRFACACGALAVTRTGSFEAMPTLAAVQTFMEQQVGTCIAIVARKKPGSH